MKKLLSVALALVAASVLPASAMALDTTQAFEVRILVANDCEEDGGRWYFELDESDDYACNYTVEWESPTGQISTDCVFQEAKVHGRRSCIRNSCQNFSTLLSLQPGCGCLGFSDLGLLEEVLLLSMGESPFDELNGIVLLTGPTGTPHGIRAVGI